MVLRRALRTKTDPHQSGKNLVRVLLFYAM